MNRRLLALALSGALSLSLLAGCAGGAQPGPSEAPPTASEPLSTPPGTPAPTGTPGASPTPTEGPEATEPSAPDASTPAVPTEKPSAKPTAKPAPTAKPTIPPTSKPSAAPTPAPTPPPSAAPEADKLQQTWDEIAKLDLPALMDVDDATLSDLYGIAAADLDGYLCKVPMMNVQATEFFLAKVKDGKLDTVKSALETRQKTLEEQWASYLPAQLELVQNYKLVTNGNYVLFAISDSADAAVTAFQTYTK